VSEEHTTREEPSPLDPSVTLTDETLTVDGDGRDCLAGKIFLREEESLELEAVPLSRAGSLTEVDEEGAAWESSNPEVADVYTADASRRLRSFVIGKAPGQARVSCLLKDGTGGVIDVVVLAGAAVTLALRPTGGGVAGGKAKD
jgi:hypothetical protein